VVHLRAASTS